MTSRLAFPSGSCNYTFMTPPLIPHAITPRTHQGPTAEKVAMPLGGLGSGCVLLQANGGLSGWSLRHIPDLVSEPIVFASVCARGTQGFARILQGQTPDWRIMLTRGTNNFSNSGQGAPGQHFGLPCFPEAVCHRAFPLQETELSDPDLPLRVSVGGWSPFIPGDSEATSLPVANVEYVLTNTGDTSLDLVFGFHSVHLLANGSREDKEAATARRIGDGFVLDARNAPPKDGQAGETAGESGRGPEGSQPRSITGSLAVTLPGEEVLVDAAWLRSGWFDLQTDLWRRISEGRHAERPAHGDGRGERGASVTTAVTLAAGESRRIRVQIAWFVAEVRPRAQWQSMDPWYAGRFGSIDGVVTHATKAMPALRERTLRFAETLHGGDLPETLREAVASNLAILKSPSLLRVGDGRIWGWEGCHDAAGSCEGSCTHVYNYAQALADLFPDLERGLRESEFLLNQFARGEQRFRHAFPLGSDIGDTWGLLPAADGQLGGLIKLYRDWRRSGDTAWLRRLWPAARASLEFCIQTWDPDRDGHLAEPHHNTYDIEFWGEDPLCQCFYIGALDAAIALAHALGEEAGDWPALRDRAHAVLREVCHNGRHLCQRVRWKDLRANDPTVGKIGHEPPTAEVLACIDREGPKYQHGEGLLSDALLAVWMARHAGLGPIIDEDLERGHLAAIVRHNAKASLRDHACPQRPAYAVADEAGLIMCSWPDGGRPTMPFPYSDEVWTGVEYQVAAHLITIGETEAGTAIVERLRARYDGRRRNPFNEFECGHFYIRALASYGLVQAWSGVRYDGVAKTLVVEDRGRGDFTCFFAHGTAWGSAGLREGKPFLDLVEGDLEVGDLHLAPAH